MIFSYYVYYYFFTIIVERLRHIEYQIQEKPTALTLASMWGYADSARLLLEAGANKEARDTVRPSERFAILC
jgi:hypothetical protein